MTRRHLSKAEVVDERLRVTVKIASDMRKLVQKREPEIIDAVITQRQRNNWRSTFDASQGRSVQVSLRQMGITDKMVAPIRQSIL
jgi:hypothetical protein